MEIHVHTTPAIVYEKDVDLFYWNVFYWNVSAKNLPLPQPFYEALFVGPFEFGHCKFTE